MVSTPPELKWYQHSFLFVLMSFLLLPRSPVIWLILFMVGMVNTDKDKWFKNRFLVFLVSVVALFGVLQWLYNKANS